MMPAALARDRSGKLSAMSAAPAAHSPPMPKPVRKRKIASSHQLLAMPHSPVKVA